MGPVDNGSDCALRINWIYSMVGIGAIDPRRSVGRTAQLASQPRLHLRQVSRAVVCSPTMPSRTRRRLWPIAVRIFGGAVPTDVGGVGAGPQRTLAAIHRRGAGDHRRASGCGPCRTSMRSRERLAWRD